MAITTNTFTINAGFARSDVITQLESAFSWLGFHGGTQTGIVTGISAYSGGGTQGTSATFQDVRPLTTTGIGTGASFYVTRSGGVINAVYVNRPGVGYTNGEYVTLSAADIGGGAAVALGITVTVAGNASPIGYGSTNAFYDKDLTAGASLFPWGVLRKTIQSNKKFGDTYRSFQVTGGTASAAFTLYTSVGSGFHPWDIGPAADKTNYNANRFAGESYYELPGFNMQSTSNQLSNSSIGSKNYQEIMTITSSSGNSYALDLNVYRSGIDPNFAVLSYRQPTLSSTHLTGNTYYTFFIHNFTTSLWNLDDVYLSGLTEISPTTGNTTVPGIDFVSFNCGNDDYQGNNYINMRCAESGYHRANGAVNADAAADFLTTTYRSNAYVHNKGNTGSTKRIYYRSNSLDSYPVGSSSDFNSVIKGIPLSGMMIPCPYYLPDDFVLIDFDYATPSANIQQNDTITISGSEVYTVITGSYNQTTRTRGILFCARIV